MAAFNDISLFTGKKNRSVVLGDF